jgi:hypothetical protein
VKHQPPIAHDPGYDPKELRVFPSVERLRRLPIKTITQDEDYELRCGWYWNGTEYYPPEIQPEPGEVGYDQHARYVLIA